MMELDLNLANRVVSALADAGIAPRAALKLHATLHGDLGLNTFLKLGDAAYAIALRFEVLLMWTDIRGWQTLADVVRSVQCALEAR